jgi:hypothetical protein
MPKRQLLLARFLYDEGRDMLDISNPFSCGLAISLFQDSVEILIWTIAKEREASINDNDPFTKLWDAVKVAKNNPEQIELPLKAKMLEMNKARVNFKHYGNLPDPSEAIKFQGYTEEFLRRATELFFEIDFYEISLADLVSNESVREKIKKTEEYFKVENWQECIRECAETQNMIPNPFDKILPPVDNRLKDVPSIDSDITNIAREKFSYICEYLGALRTLGMSSMLTISPVDYLKFNSIIPHVQLAVSGKKTIVYTRSIYTAKEAEFCLKFITKYALTAQGIKS